MVGKSGHLDIALVSVGLACLDDTKDLADKHGVVGIGFVEIPDPVKEHRFRVLSLHGKKLLDQRSVFWSLAFRHLLTLFL